MTAQFLSRVRERIRVANLQPSGRRPRGTPSLPAGAEAYPGHRLREFLGRGAFGEVWTAEVTNGRPVALKFLPLDSSTQELRTLQKIRQIRHPNLVQIDRVWCWARHIVVSMELAEGGLDDLLNVYLTEFDEPMGPAQTCHYLGQIAAALDFLNVRQHRVDGQMVAMRHCDVKPSNMLLFGKNVKLTDFGLSVLATASSQAHSRSGTPAYAAPEVFQGRITERTDQYALAISYCELRGGRLPFADTPSTLARDYVRPRPDLTMLPVAERSIVIRALSPDSLDRWPSCTEFIARLTASQ